MQPCIPEVLCETLNVYNATVMKKFSVCNVITIQRHLSGLVVRVPGCTTEMYCVSCEVRTEFMCYVEESRLPLWSSSQGSLLHIQRSSFDYRRYQIF
jgi:hypothetical protein